jgi:hypothetical protein
MQTHSQTKQIDTSIVRQTAKWKAIDKLQRVDVLMGYSGYTDLARDSCDLMARVMRCKRRQFIAQINIKWVK